MRTVQKPSHEGKGEARPYTLTKLRTRDEATGELRPLTPVEAAPLVACLRAPAKGYPEIDVETFMLLAWICFTWERTGTIPKGPPPSIVFAEPTDAKAGRS